MKVLPNLECKSGVHSNHYENVQLCQAAEKSDNQKRFLKTGSLTANPYTGMETEKLKPTNAQL
jgi:hypothetical protein